MPNYAQREPAVLGRLQKEKVNVGAEYQEEKYAPHADFETLQQGRAAAEAVVDAAVVERMMWHGLGQEHSLTSGRWCQ